MKIFSSFRRRSNIPWLIIGLILVLLLAAIALALFLILRNANNKQPTPGPISSFPANIEYDVTGYGVYIQSNLTNPNIAGVDINLNWVDVETQPGVFNWTPADNEMAVWASHGKKFTLIARYVQNVGESGGSCSGKQYLPAWEIARIPTICTSGGAIVPDFFDPTFKADLQAYVTAIAQHVAASPYKNNLLYVRIGLGTAGEGYPCTSCDSSDLQKLVSWGYSAPNWIMWQEQMLSFYKSAFSFTNVIYPLGDQDKDPSSGQQVQQIVGYWAAANGMGVGQQGLADTPGYQNGTIVSICKYVRAHYPSAYIQFQTVHAVTSASQVQGDIAIANDAGAFSIEWYSSDTTNSAYQPLFQQWQQMVASKRPQSATK